MGKLGVLFIASIITLLLGACGNSQVSEDVAEPQQADVGNINYEIIPNWEWFEAYTYRRRRVDLPAMDQLQTTLLYGNVAYFCFINVDSTKSQIVVAGITSSGDEISRTEIPLYSEYTQVVGFGFVNGGNLAILAIEFDGVNGEVLSVFYAEHDTEGGELTRHDFSNVFSQISGDFEIMQAIFINDGKIAVSVLKGFGAEIYLFGADGEHHSSLQLNGRAWGSDMVKLGDSHIFAVDEFPNATLREVDFAQGEWGESLPLVSRSNYDLFPAGSSSSFDFLATDGVRVYGYTIETQMQTALFNLAEVGLRNVMNAYESADGSLLILSGNWENDFLTPELYVLLPISRDAPDERTIITVGAVAQPYWFPRMIADFNNKSDAYRVELIEFRETSDWSQIDRALMRLQVELMTGRGPDIVILPSGWMMNHSYLLDLYPLIDLDDDLSRADFLPNMLAALEGEDGTLPMVTDYFTIRTVIGLPEAAERIDIWTPEEMLRVVHQTHETHYPFRPGQDSEWFIRAMLTYSGTDFIDWYTMQANLDNAAFVEVLETAKLINDVRSDAGWTDPLVLMSRGEQLLDLNIFFGWGAYRTYLTVLDDFNVLGLPTVDGGKNVLVPNLQMGISVVSENADGAWEFLRNFLLPEAVATVAKDGMLPFRIDTFNDILTDISTPRMEADENGAMVEVPQSELWFNSGVAGVFDIVGVYAITQEQAENFKSIVENAVPMRGQVIYQGLWDLIGADIERFFMGSATAEDTARVIQSRVSIYLAERG